jgi:hypothetical protein
VLEECFDPEIVLYTPDGEYYGRKQAFAYLEERYMKYAPNLCYRMKLQDVKSFGDALWYSMAVASRRKMQIVIRRTYMCRRARKWVMNE